MLYYTYERIGEKMKNYLKLIRVKHWFKNILVFLPLFFSMNLFNRDYLLLTTLAFFIFCITSSIVYVINDISDVEKDRKHEIKKHRPLASGAISIKNAHLLIIFLLMVNIALIVLQSIIYKSVNNNIGIIGILIPIVYLILNILYSKWLKNVPIIDVVILVSGFLLRVVYGGVIINVEISKWLYLMVIFGAFYLGFGKRRNEIIKNGDSSRKVLKYYNKEFLDKNLYVALGLAIVSYSLWTVDTLTITRLNSEYLFWTIPIIMIIFQLYSLDIERDSHGDPIEVVFSDKVLLATILLYIVIIVILVYVI